MGKEAACNARLGDRTSHGKAHLETASLRFTGDFRFNVAIAEMRGVVAQDGELRFSAPIGAVALQLGAAAERWARAIQHPKSVIEKLGVKSGQRVCAIDLEDRSFLRALHAALDADPAAALRGRFDLIFKGLARPPAPSVLARLCRHLAPDGALWLVYPKGRASPVAESAVRRALLAAGLVDTKVAAFSATHTAIKAVIPVARRTVGR